MVAIGEGAKAQVEEAFAAMGTNLLIVLPGCTSRAARAAASASMPTLTWDDLAAIRREVPARALRGRAARARAPQLMSEDQNWTTSVTGTTPEYFEIRNWPVARGRRCTTRTSSGGARSSCSGETVVDKLYGATPIPIGQTVRIRNIPFQVVGVLDRRASRRWGRTTTTRRSSRRPPSGPRSRAACSKYISGTIYGRRPPRPTTPPRAEKEMTDLLRDRHHLAPAPTTTSRSAT